MNAAKRPPPEPSVKLHAFAPDPDIPADHKGTQVCLCGKPGRPGEDQHPDGAPPLVAVFDPARVLPPTHPDDVSDRIIGEAE